MLRNTIKTILLLGSLSGLVLAIGALSGGTTGLHIAFIIALVINGSAYFFSDKLVLRMYKAQPLDQHAYQWIYSDVDELSNAMHIPMPKLWLIPQDMANAFATGRNPRHASVALTRGIIDRLDRDELRGVIAHELAHVKHRDTLIATIAATLATTISYLASMLRFGAFWGNSNRRKGNPLAMLLVGIVTPLIATLIQLAISRSREYSADEAGANYSHDPLALANALEKLHAEAKTSPKHEQHASTASLFIVNPLRGTNALNLLSTHPPVDKRIARLHALQEQNVYSRW